MKLSIGVAQVVSAATSAGVASASLGLCDLSQVLQQEGGKILSRKAHGAHHKAPFENNYAIVSGWWNPLLDAGGDGRNFWRKFEHFIKARTGAEPRCWYEPKYEVEDRLSS